MFGVDCPGLRFFLRVLGGGNTSTPVEISLSDHHLGNVVCLLRTVCLLDCFRYGLDKMEECRPTWKTIVDGEHENDVRSPSRSQMDNQIATKTAALL